MGLQGSEGTSFYFACVYLCQIRRTQATVFSSSFHCILALSSLSLPPLCLIFQRASSRQQFSASMKRPGERSRKNRVHSRKAYSLRSHGNCSRIRKKKNAKHSGALAIVSARIHANAAGTSLLSN